VIINQFHDQFLAESDEIELKFLVSGLLILFFSDQSANMQNEEGQNVDLYVPRKCSATNRLITSKDHASVQINVGHLDANGRYTGQFSTFALCGFVRAQGDGDSALDRLWQRKKAELRQ
ncbi:40S ribosomal protein S21-2, partial [Linum perenne]